MKRPSPSMIVALLALFVALGGTATAARVLITSSRQIKDGAVRRADIAKSAVDSARVANGSLSRSDLDADTQSALAQAGTQVLEAFRADGPRDNESKVEKVVATLSNIPPGAYAIFAKSVLSGAADSGLFGQGNSVGGVCRLDVQGDSDQSRTVLAGPGTGGPSGVNMQITRSYSSPGTAQVVCTVDGAKWSASNTSIIALRVASPTRQPVDGR